jgi:hypothetical protein
VVRNYMEIIQKPIAKGFPTRGRLGKWIFIFGAVLLFIGVILMLYQPEHILVGNRTFFLGPEGDWLLEPRGHSPLFEYGQLISDRAIIIVIIGFLLHWKRI